MTTPHDTRVQELLGSAGPIARRLCTASGHRGVTLGSYDLIGRNERDPIRESDHSGHLSRLTHSVEFEKSCCAPE